MQREDQIKQKQKQKNLQWPIAIDSTGTIREYCISSIKT